MMNQSELHGAMLNPAGYMKRKVETEIARKIIRRIKEGKSVVPTKHQATCPSCERRNVNLYYMNKVWQCKACHDKEGSAAK